MSPKKDEPNDRTEFMLSLLNKAQTLIQEALAAGRHNDATQLYRGNGNDIHATAGALLSAWESFERGLGDAPREVDDFTSLAGAFIHLAFNRMRRQEYHGKRLSGQVERGKLLDGAGEPIPFDPVDKKNREGLLKILGLEIGGVLSNRTPRDRLVIELHLAGHTYEDIAQRAPSALPDVKSIAVATISRIVQAFRDDMRERLKDD